MNELQVWTLMGVFSAVLFSVLALMHRSVKAGFDGLAARIDGQNIRIGARGERLGTLIGARGERLETLIEAQGERLETLIEAQGERLETMIEAQGARIEAQGAVMAANFSDVDHRLSNIEDDMRLVKAHLIGQRSA